MFTSQKSRKYTIVALGEVLLYIGRSLATWIIKPRFSIVSTMILLSQQLLLSKISHKTLIGKKLHYTSEIYIFLMMCLHVFILLLKSPSFLVEIRGGAISKGNGEGDSLKGLLQEFPFFYFSTFIICGSKIQSKILPFHFLTFSCSLIYILYHHTSNSSHKGYGD